MTISSSTNKSGPYNGNGSTTVFARTFRVLEADHLKVYQTISGVTTEVTTGITKDGIGSDTGNVTFSTAPATGTQITLLREVPLTQETDYSAQGKVSPEQVEDDFDLQEMQIQDVSERIDRSYTAPVTGKSFTNGNIPKFDASGDLVDSGTSVDGVAGDASTASSKASEASNSAAEAAASATAASAYRLPRFASLAAFQSDSKVNYSSSDSYSVSAGDEIEIGKHRYEVQTSGATDSHFENSNTTPVKIKLMPGEDGRYNAQGMGAVADGSDNFDGYTFGQNKDTGGEWHSDFDGGVVYAAGFSYVEGDVFFCEDDDRGYVALTDFTSVDIATDLAAGNVARGAFSGTDNRAALQLCIDHFVEKGLPVYVPAGTYRVLENGVAAGGAVFNMSDADLSLLSSDGAVILLDEAESRLTTGSGGIFLFDSRQEASPYSRRSHKDFALRGFVFRGRWSHAPGGEGDYANGSGLCPVRVEGYQRLRIECGFYDIRNKAMRNKHNDQSDYSGCFGERAARGFIRDTNTNQARIIGFNFRQSADDAIDFSLSDEVGADGPRGAMIRDGFLSDCKSINAGTAFDVTITGVVAQRMRNGFCYASRGGASSPDSGKNGKASIRIEGNDISDPLNLYDTTTEALLESDDSGVITLMGNIRPRDWSAGDTVVAGEIRRSTTDSALYSADAAGTTAGNDTDLDGGSDTGVDWTVVSDGVLPGEWDSTAGNVRAPWENSTDNDASSYMGVGSFSTDLAGRSSLYRINNNKVYLSKPQSGNYYDWGEGWMFDASGPKNPAITAAKYRTDHVRLVYDLEDARVQDNTFIGLDRAAVLIADGSADPATAFRNVRITDNDMIGQAENSIWIPDPGEDVHWPGFVIAGNNMDLDRWHRNARRAAAADGSWQATSSSNMTGTAIAAERTGTYGLEVRANDFRNTYRAYRQGASGSDDWLFEGNRQHCEPAAVGAHDSGNLGIGLPLAVDAGFTIIPTRSDPSGTDEGQRYDGMELNASAQPTSGWFAQGHFVRATDYTDAVSGQSVLGWLRLTTGNTHTAADWQVVTLEARQRITKTADTERSSTTSASNDPDLQVTLDAGTYEFEMSLLVECGSTEGVKLNLVGSNVSSIFVTTDILNGETSRTEKAKDNLDIDNITGDTAVKAVYTGTVTQSASGNFRLRWAQVVSGATATKVLAGSTLRWSKVS